MTQKHTFPTLPVLRIVVTMIVTLCLALPIAALPADTDSVPEATQSSESNWFDQIWAGATRWLAEIWPGEEDLSPSSVHGQGERGPMVDPSGSQ